MEDNTFENLINSICEHQLLDNNPNDWTNLIREANSSRDK